MGWKDAKKLPKWIGNANSWIDFISGKKDNEINRVQTTKMAKRIAKRRKG
jgi:hypothetical protein